MYEFTGTVVEVCEVQTFPSGFTKRELVVREPERGEWENDVTFNFKKENIGKLADVRCGDRVKVSFVLDGRSWTDPRTNKVRHFSDLVGLGVEIVARAVAEPEPSAEDRAAQAAAAALADDSDMPF